MKQTKAPKLTPSPTQGLDKPQAVVGKADRPGEVFISMALDMSWRLAIVFLVPIIGGSMLDDHFKTSVFIIIGFILALCGFGLVLWRMLQVVNNIPVAKKEKDL